MAIGPRLELKHSQSLVMTPQLRQAIKLLQCSNLEVAAFVDEELERNPLLERDDTPLPGLPDAAADGATGFEDAPPPRDAAELMQSAALPGTQAEPLEIADHAETYDPGGSADGAAFQRGSSGSFDGDEFGPDDIAAAGQSLHERLREQLRLNFSDRVDRLIGAHLIGLLEPSGRMSTPVGVIAAALSVAEARVEAVRQAMMRFDPTGMFAASLRECLAVQLAERNRLDPAMAALLANLDLLASRDLKRLMALCEVDAEDMADMVAELRRLDPKPGANADAPMPQARIPDVLMRATPDGSWLLEINPETLPRVAVNHGLAARLTVHASREDRAFMTDRLQSAQWLLRTLEQRSQTILRVAGEIVRRQDGFFRAGISQLRPLILRDVAAALDLHESTVSRVTANKSIASPRGNFDLKFFFTTAIAGTLGEEHSAEAVRHRIREMIAAETADAVLSDDAIVANLRREGVDIARRTVAKYRDALRIPSSVQRRREKAELA